MTSRHAHLLLAGATGPLGNEVLRVLVGLRRFANTRVLAREAMTPGLRGVSAEVVPGEDPALWPTVRGEAAVVMFDPPRMFYERERALWTPDPAQLPALAAWLRRCGVQTLAIVLPHDAMRLPESLKRSLSSLDEHAIAACGFERLLIIRSARQRQARRAAHAAGALAQWMLGVLAYMIPSSEQPVRAAQVARFVAHALELAPRGIHVAAPETVWQAAQALNLHDAVRHWLDGAPAGASPGAEAESR